MHDMFKCKPCLFKRPYLDFKLTFKNPGLQKHELQVAAETGSRMSSVLALQAFPLCQLPLFPYVNYLLKQFLLNTNVFVSVLCSKLKQVCHYFIIRRLKKMCFSSQKSLSGETTDYRWSDRFEIRKVWAFSRQNNFLCPDKKRSRFIDILALKSLK